MNTTKVDDETSRDRIKAKNVQFIPCIQAKSVLEPVHQLVNGFTKPLELRHTDMTGSISKLLLGGAHYFVVSLDNCTGMRSTFVSTKKCCNLWNDYSRTMLVLKTSPVIVCMLSASIRRVSKPANSFSVLSPIKAWKLNFYLRTLASLMERRSASYRNCVPWPA